jgi:hypothetical protein
MKPIDAPWMRCDHVFSRDYVASNLLKVRLRDKMAEMSGLSRCLKSASVVIRHDLAGARSRPSIQRAPRRLPWLSLPPDFARIPI